MGHRQKHTVNGKFYGNWHVLDSGRELYLAHRKKSEIYQKRYAWCLDTATLDAARRRGVWAIGVIVRSGGVRQVWLTHIDDFFDSPLSFPHFGSCRQRGLPLSQFRIDPSKSLAVIASAVKLHK